MVFRQYLGVAIVFSGTVFVSSPADAADPVPKPVYTFSALKSQPADIVKLKLETLLKATGKFDQAKFDAVWSQQGRSVSDATLQTIALGLPETVALMADAKRVDTLPPIETPTIFQDTKLDPYIRSNLAASYAKALAGKRGYEEALAVTKTIQPEQLIDPASYFFYKAVAEHALMQREAAVSSIVRLLDDVTDAPDRYKVVATLMFFDLQNWAKDDKDLTNIGRLMDNSGRRLDLARGGPQTQEIQKKIVFRLDEKIKELETKSKSQQKSQGEKKPGEKGEPNDGSCPSGGEPGNGNPSGKPNAPQDDSKGGTDSGPGQVDVKKLRNYEQVWGKLPEVERKKITQDFIREMPPKFKPMIEDYFRSLNRMNGFKQ